jgi:hypothetical protein
MLLPTLWPHPARYSEARIRSEPCNQWTMAGNGLRGADSGSLVRVQLVTIHKHGWRHDVRADYFTVGSGESANR